jgi:redox-sensitive bicupin YhaK (pirin superfamily)
MIERRVKDVVTPLAASDGAGVRLRRSIATEQLDHLDPFFLFDHFGSEDPGDYIAGFPMHPHRGIETVTYMLDGSVAHRDSLGNSGVIGAGDVQWMTAGSATSR